MELMDRAASDWTFLTGLLRVLRRVAPIARHRNHTVRDMADELAAQHGDRVALRSEAESLTFTEWNRLGNRYARWAMGAGVGKGDVVLLLMPNRPTYLSVWLGIARAGGVTALANTNLTGPALAHSVNTVGARVAVVDASLLPHFQAAAEHFDHPVAVHVWGANPEGLPRLDEAVAALPGEPIPAAELPPLTITDKCLYVYTSGTTGRPKAANINHYRVQLIMRGFSALSNAKGEDVIYDALPMYHTNGGVIAPGITLVSGGTCYIREKFSAHEFWPDIRRIDATLFIYIGELCRYLVNTPPSPEDKKHRVRACVGNGLRPDVWVTFVDRFGLKQILEFYAATEGNCSMFNLDSRPGAVGRIPPWLSHRFPVKVVKFDVESEQVVRGPDGLCIAMPPGEPGEVIGEIVEDAKKPANRFDGYADKASTNAKILRDVFRRGDAWFRTGDLMRRDKRGYFYFVDRIGDTFRWKGENVATSDVTEAVSAFPKVRDATVYGVKVPGRDGRAGMASVVVDDLGDFDMAAFPAFLATRLPDYAWPVFLRFPQAIEMTGTFKQRKTELVREGFDLALVREPLFYRDPHAKTFVPLDEAALRAINGGDVRL